MAVYLVPSGSLVAPARFSTSEPTSVTGVPVSNVVFPSSSFLASSSFLGGVSGGGFIPISPSG